jgi:hypothetical protein
MSSIRVRVSFETVRLQALRSGSQGVVAVMRKSLLRDPVTSLTMDPKVRLGRRLGPTDGCGIRLGNVRIRVNR